MKKYNNIVQHILVLYVVFSVLGISVMMFIYKNDSFTLLWPTETKKAQNLFFITLLCIPFLLSVDAILELIHSYRQHKFRATILLGNISYFDAFYLSLFSAMGEELLFRGAIQPALGLGLTSLLFGILHVNLSRGLMIPLFLATFSGLLLGWVFLEFNSLLSVIFIHFLFNFFVLFRFVRYRKSRNMRKQRN